MRIAIAVLAVILSGCTGLPALSTGRGQAHPPAGATRPAPPPPRTAVIAINNPTAAPTRPIRPRIHVEHPAGRPFQLWILLLPARVPCPVPDDPFWPAGHPRTCSLGLSIRPAALGPAEEGRARPR